MGERGMKKKSMSRLYALLTVLAVCLTLLTAPALAAPVISEAEEQLTQAAQSANLTRKGPAEFVSAAQAGSALTAELTAPADLDAQAPVLVLVQAVDGTGAPLSGSPVRYCLGTLTGEGKVSLRYQQAGCSSFVMMAAQPAVNHGSIRTLTASGEYHGGICIMTYSASLVMSEDMATVVTVNKDDSETLKTLRFTCYLEDELLRGISDFSQADIAFSGSELYEPVDVAKTERGVAVTYKLRDSAVEGWRTQDVVSVKAALQTEMTMSCRGEVSTADVTAALGESGELYTCGRLEITRPGGQVPYFHCERVVVPAAPVSVSFSSASSGGSPTAPIEVEESAHGEVHVPSVAPVGNIVTVELEPEPGFTIRYLFVVDDDGQLVDLTVTGEDTYSFVMPRGGVSVMSGFRKVLADPEDTGVSQTLITEQHMAFMKGDDKGNFRPDDSITRAEVAQMFYRLLQDRTVTELVEFSDVPADAWYAQAVGTLAGLGIVNGVGDGRFAPERQITRAEFAVLCARFADKWETGTEFADVPADHWAYDEISTAAAYGWINGIGNDLFAPERQITRAEAAALTNRVLGRLGDIVAIQKGAGREFPDVTGQHWAYGEIAEAATDHRCTFNDTRTLEYWDLK